jgi:chromosome segregation ATPase
MVQNLRQQKLDAAKQRRKTQRELEKASSLNRRSSSGLTSLQRRLEDTREKLVDINTEFNQILARKESLERLIKAANERLKQETDAKEQAEIDLGNAETDEERQTATERLNLAIEKIQELKSEIKQRELASQKLVSEIESHKKSKSKTNQQIHKQTKAKPTLVGLIKKSGSAKELLKRRVSAAEKRESNIDKTLQKASKRLEEIMAKKRRRAAKKAARKRALALKKAARKMMLAKKNAKKSRTKIKKRSKPKKSTKKSTKKSRR